MLWLLGLFLAFIAKPAPVSQEALAAFKAKVKQARLQAAAACHQLPDLAVPKLARMVMPLHVSSPGCPGRCANLVRLLSWCCRLRVWWGS